MLLLQVYYTIAMKNDHVIWGNWSAAVQNGTACVLREKPGIIQIVARKYSNNIVVVLTWIKLQGEWQSHRMPWLALNEEELSKLRSVLASDEEWTQEMPTSEEEFRELLHDRERF